MRLAAIDTSTRWCGVALLAAGSPGREDGPVSVVAEAGAVATPSHGAVLLALLEAALDVVGWQRASIDGYAVSRGPGSFTGLRIGLGTGRGLAIAAGRPCIGVGTLEAVAAAYGPAPSDRVAVLDAGRGEVFAARFDPVASPPQTLDPPWVGPFDACLARFPGPAVWFGPGVDRHRPPQGLGAGRTAGGAPRGVAAAVGRLAVAAFRAGAQDGAGMSPLYVRPPDATEPGGR